MVGVIEKLLEVLICLSHKSLHGRYRTHTSPIQVVLKYHLLFLQWSPDPPPVV